MVQSLRRHIDLLEIQNVIGGLGLQVLGESLDFEIGYYFEDVFS
jgi:hypothetical protein